jgi:hypothetical protein
MVPKYIVQASSVSCWLTVRLLQLRGHKRARLSRCHEEARGQALGEAAKVGEVLLIFCWTWGVEGGGRSTHTWPRRDGA